MWLITAVAMIAYSRNLTSFLLYRALVLSNGDSIATVRFRWNVTCGKKYIKCVEVHAEMLDTVGNVYHK